MYELNDKPSKYMMEKWKGLKGKISNSIIPVGDFNTFLSVMI